VHYGCQRVVKNQQVTQDQYAFAESGLQARPLLLIEPLLVFRHPINPKLRIEEMPAGPREGGVLRWRLRPREASTHRR